MKYIPLTRPLIHDEDIANMVEVLQSGFLVQGKNVERLEDFISSYIGTKYAVSVSNGTASLHLSLLGLGIGEGDEVIVPAFSFIATANVVELVGAKPVFVDICPKTFNIVPEKIEPAISEKTKAIIAVHEFGCPANLSTLIHISKTYNLPIIEDAACALGAEWRGKKIGSFGIAGSFSFHPRKSVTCGEGGILTTNDYELADFYRVMRNHGAACSAKGGFVRAGFNYRMTDIQASLLIGQLCRLEDIHAERRHIASRYNDELTDNWISKPVYAHDAKSSWQSYHIVLDKTIDRDGFIEYLRDNNIEVGLGAQCIPMQKYYHTKYGYTQKSFPEAWRAYTKGIVLPLFAGLKDEQVTQVIERINSYLKT